MGGTGSGDRLARGAVRANFGSMAHIKQDKWDDIFKDFDAKAFSGDADSKKAGNARPKSRKTKVGSAVRLGL